MAKRIHDLSRVFSTECHSTSATYLRNTGPVPVKSRQKGDLHQASLRLWCLLLFLGGKVLVEFGHVSEIVFFWQRQKG